MRIVAQFDAVVDDATTQWIVEQLTAPLDALGHSITTVATEATDGDAVWKLGPDVPSAVALGVDAAQFHSSTNRAFERSALQIAGSDCAVVMARRLVEGCGATSLADAASRLRGRCPNLRTAVVGDGPLQEAVSQQLHVTGAEDRVRVIGAVTADTRARWLATADLAVAHARIPDWTGLALREALACGTPVLANYARFDAVPPHPDLALEHGGAPELSQRLARWAEDRDTLAGLREACAAHPLAQRSWIDVARDLVAALASH